ncbi:MAG TPA: hypothetical protein VMN38_11500 [Sphingomicrobium sp.]|nr:hypothetical protein [Sphingomicrobium sp.]
MTTHAQFYLTRAAVARELAEGSKLDNVRESHLRAAETWDQFAARAMKADLMRAEEIKRKSAESESMGVEEAKFEPENSPPKRESGNDQNSRGLGVF